VEAVILIGVQGSGKSTFYREKFFDSHVRISLDLLRTRQRERVLMQACLASGQRFAVDNTNVLRVDRAVYIEAAKAAGFRVTGYFFDVELKEALRRNGTREGTAKIPVPGVIGTWKRLERPELSEGFDELVVVKHE
jgi:predicted kinase